MFVAGGGGVVSATSVGFAAEALKAPATYFPVGFSSLADAGGGSFAWVDPPAPFSAPGTYFPGAPSDAAATSAFWVIGDPVEVGEAVVVAAGAGFAGFP